MSTIGEDHTRGVFGESSDLVLSGSRAIPRGIVLVDNDVI